MLPFHLRQGWPLNPHPCSGGPSSSATHPETSRIPQSQASAMATVTPSRHGAAPQHPQHPQHRGGGQPGSDATSVTGALQTTWAALAFPRKLSATRSREPRQGITWKQRPTALENALLQNPPTPTPAGFISTETWPSNALSRLCPAALGALQGSWCGFHRHRVPTAGLGAPHCCKPAQVSLP